MGDQDGSKGGVGTPPGTEGTGDGGGSPSTPSNTPASIPVSVLPKELQGLPAEKVGSTLNDMLTALVQSNQRRMALEAEITAMKTPATPVLPKDLPKELKVPEGKTFADWLLEEPEAALDYHIQNKYGNVANALSGTQDRLGQIEFANVAREIDDFQEFEADVRQLLADARADHTRANILGAYTLAVGNKTIAARNLAKRAGANSETAAPDGATPKKEYPKTVMSEEIRVGLNMSEEDYYEKHAPTTEFKVRVPGLS